MKRKEPFGEKASLLQILMGAFRRWWIQTLVFVIVLAALGLTGKLTIWHVFLLSIAAGVWLAALDRRR